MGLAPHRASIALRQALPVLAREAQQPLGSGDLSARWAEIPRSQNSRRHGSAQPALAADIVDGDPTCVDLTILEGRYRQVRRCWEALSGNRVVRLLRLSFGPIELGALEVGQCRELDVAEVEALRPRAVGTANTVAGLA